MITKKNILFLVIVIILAVIAVSLSPFIFIYSKTEPLVEGGHNWDTITHYYSGLPIPYMIANNLSMSKKINFIIYFIDIFMFSCLIVLIRNITRKIKISSNNAIQRTFPAAK